MKIPDEVPGLFQKFTLVDEVGDLAVPQLAKARMESSFAWFNRNSNHATVEPLQLLRGNETWWRFDDDLDLRVTVAISNLPIEICKFFSSEAICIRRFLNDETDWSDRLSLPANQVNLPYYSYEALMRIPYFEMPRTIIESVTPSENYHPFCHRYICGHAAANV